LLVQKRIRKSVGVPFVNQCPDYPYTGIRWYPREASARLSPQPGSTRRSSL